MSANQPGLAESAERLAFYERIGQQHLTPLWTSLASLVTPEPTQRVPAGGVALRGHPRRDARGRRPHHRQGSRAPRPRPREPRAARPVEDHDRPLRRRAAGAAGRGRARAPARAERAALRARRRRRAHRRQRRAHDDALRATSSSRRRWPGTTTATTSGEPIFWLDGLDIPIVQFLDASFAEHLDDDEQPISRPAGDAEARFGSNLLPVDHRPATGASPVFNYPYARTREALATLAATRCLGSLPRPEDALQQPADRRLSA